MPPPDDSAPIELHDTTPFGETEGEWGRFGCVFATTPIVFGELGYGKATMLKSAGLASGFTDEAAQWAHPGWARALNAMRPVQFAVGRYGKSSGFDFITQAMKRHQAGDELSGRQLARMFSFWLEGIPASPRPQQPLAARVHTRLSELAVNVPQVYGPRPKPVHLTELKRPWENERPQARTNWKSPEIRRPRTRSGKRM